MRRPKRFEWAKMNLDTGVAVNTCPLNFGPDGAGERNILCERPVESAFLMVELGNFNVTMTNGLCRSLNGRPSGLHIVFERWGEIACKRHEEFYLGSDCGFVIPVHSKIGKDMKINFDTEENSSFWSTSTTTSSISNRAKM